MRSPLIGCAAARRRQLLVVLALACAAPGVACDGTVMWVVKRETLAKGGCSSNMRTLLFEYQHRGAVRTVRSEVSLDTLPEGQWVGVFDHATGTGVTWGKLSVLCPTGGTGGFESGLVRREEFCRAGTFSGFVFLDGLPPGAASGRCCPKSESCWTRARRLDRSSH